VIAITVARRPLSEVNVAANVLKHGCGSLNINASRIATVENLNGGAYSAAGAERHDGAENWRYKRGEHGNLAGIDFKQPPGRWPANLILGHLAGCCHDGNCAPGCPVAALDIQTGDRPVSGAARTGHTAETHDPQGVTYFGDKGSGATHNDAGGASRYFKQIGSAS